MLKLSHNDADDLDIERDKQDESVDKAMGIRKKMRRPFYRDFCRRKGQI